MLCMLPSLTNIQKYESAKMRYSFNNSCNVCFVTPTTKHWNATQYRSVWKRKTIDFCGIYCSSKEQNAVAKRTGAIQSECL